MDGHSQNVQSLSHEDIRRAVRAALAEDIGSGDVTTLAKVPATSPAVAIMRAREPLVVAGLALAEAAFRLRSRAVRIKRLARDGQQVAAGARLLEISGAARAILGAERVALNFVQRLGGVATLTAQFVDAIKGTRAQILDTRKTTPGWRHFEKYAVVCGGGRNYRIGLYDMVLIKDNHLAALRDARPNPLPPVSSARARNIPNLKSKLKPTRRNKSSKPRPPVRTSSCSTTCRPPSYVKRFRTRRRSRED